MKTLFSKDILSEIEARRRELRMPRGALARRSGVCLRTVERLLSGEAKGAKWETIASMGREVGIDLGIVRRRSLRAVVHKQAKAKAEKVVAITQGDSALEGQALPEKALKQIRKAMEDSLATGSSVRLWSET